VNSTYIRMYRATIKIVLTTVYIYKIYKPVAVSIFHR